MPRFCITLLFLLVCVLVSEVGADDLQLGRVNFTLFDNVLREFVHLVDNSSVVDYANLSKSIEFRNFTRELEKANTSLLNTTEEWAAFWINSYNALVLQNIIQNPCKQDLFGNCGVLESIEQIGAQQPALLVKAFSRISGKVAGRDVSLDDIEQNLQKPNTTIVSNMLRIHYPLCITKASISSPNLLNRAFSPSKLVEQMHNATLLFLSNPQKGSYYFHETKQLRLSEIFDEYYYSFIDLVHPGYENRSILWFLLPYFREFMNPTDVDQILANLNHVNATIDYFKFDWKLNGDVKTLCSSPTRPCFPWYGMLGVIVVVMLLICLVFCFIQRRRNNVATGYSTIQ